MERNYQVIKRPVISEKGTALAEVGNRYVFEVALHSNKQEIRTAVEKIFGVRVREVRTMITHGKMKRVGRFVTKKSNWKKAIVTLAQGQKIDFFQVK